MRFLLDTCAILWLTLTPERLPAKVRQIFQDPNNQFCLSVVSAWEVAIKHQMGRLGLPSAPKKFLSECIEGYELTMIDVQLDHALNAGMLPAHHRDPFDRMIISQAQIEALTILTADEIFEHYDVPVVW